VSGPTQVRAGSFNLLSGRSLSDGVVDAGRLAAAVATLDADVLALQEVDRLQQRSGERDQAVDVAAVTGAEHYRYLPTIEGTPGESGWHAADGGGPDVPSYGIALLSRLPVKEWHVLRLEPGPGRYPMPIPTRPPRLILLKDEPRAVLAAVLDEPRLTVACTHLSFVPLFNARQLRRVARWLETLPGPRLLLGDLNQGLRASRRRTGWSPLITAPTFPSPAPRLQLDHVLAHDLPPGTRAEGRTHQLPVSDHRAVTADLTLP
jgi:endonuclease/exonuclease/phosphatase family metal-dependent hydrolase